MVGSQQMLKAGACCTLCPAGCSVRPVESGPDTWRVDPAAEGGGLCPRAVAVGSLLSHSGRILQPVLKDGTGRRAASMAEAVEAVASGLRGRRVTFFVDANLPCEQLGAVAGWCGAWPDAQLCFVVEPAEEQLILGVEAGGAEYLGDEQLAECGGFLIVGDAFSANPCCSRGVFERRAEQSRTPIVTLDPAGGTATKFATHALDVPPGREAEVLLAVAAGAGVEVDVEGIVPADCPAARAAGAALAGCEKPAVLIAAEYARGGRWRQVGYIASRLAGALGGGVAPQTSGANVVAAMRCGAQQGAVGLAEAVADREAAWVVVGCDLLGMLGWSAGPVLAAAAAMPNRTTEAAAVVLPVALPMEVGGVFLLSGCVDAEVDAAMPPPAGVPTAAELIERISLRAGGGVPVESDGPGSLPRLGGEVPAGGPAGEPAAGPVLVLGRQAAHAGCGALTGWGAWQREAWPVPELRLSEADAAAAGVEHLAEVTVSAGGVSLRARAQVSPAAPRGVVVLPEGSADARRLAACGVDAAAGQVFAGPAAVEITPGGGNNDA